MDKRLAAENIRKNLERRLALLLECEPEEVPRIKIGTLIHTIYTLAGDIPSFAGFPTTMTGILQRIGHARTWDIDGAETKVEDEPETEKCEDRPRAPKPAVH